VCVCVYISQCMMINDLLVHNFVYESFQVKIVQERIFIWAYTNTDFCKIVNVGRIQNLVF
jgi:hypothetical protein